MPSIENRTKQLLIVAMNSGASTYLAPGEATVVAADDISNNAKIEKLVGNGSLSIGEVVEKAASKAAPRPKKAKSQKR